MGKNFRRQPVLNKRQIGRYVEGQQLPLTKLTEALTNVLSHSDGAASIDLKIIVCDIATRKYYGPKGAVSMFPPSGNGWRSATGKEDADFASFDDVTRGPFWFWELRSLSLLPEELKGLASRTRQKHKQVGA